MVEMLSLTVNPEIPHIECAFYQLKFIHNNLLYSLTTVTFTTSASVVYLFDYLETQQLNALEESPVDLPLI